MQIVGIGRPVAEIIDIGQRTILETQVGIERHRGQHPEVPTRADVLRRVLRRSADRRSKQHDQHSHTSGFPLSAFRFFVLVFVRSFPHFGLAENKQRKQRQRHDHNANRNQRVRQALRRKTHQQQYRESEGQGRNGLQYEIIGRRGLETRVYLAQQYHTVRRRARQHTEHRKERLVRVVGIKLAAAAQHIPERNHSTYCADHQQR